MATETTVALAHRFAGNLLIDIGMDNLRKVIERNDAETYRGVCHSHDFCDANMTMAAAFEAVVGREPIGDGVSDADLALWNSAWDHAAKIFPLYVRAE